MRKFIIFKDFNLKELSPITYDEFIAMTKCYSLSDSAFEDFLKYNNYINFTDYGLDEIKGFCFKEGEPSFIIIKDTLCVFSYNVQSGDVDVI